VHLTELLATAEKAVAATKDEAEAMRLLRRMKAEAALLIALADIGGVWPVMRATHALTELADTAIRAAVRFLLRDAAARGRLKPADRSKPEEDSGHIVLAMGKMGAFELNYSSDIDLIVFYDRDAPALADKDDAAAFHVRIARGLVKLLQERTADGYVFRVDLRLRPDPASTPVAVSTETALNYYSSVGQNWERAALIKARACAGDIKAGEAILAQLAPFIWRKVSRLCGRCRHRGAQSVRSMPIAATRTSPVEGHNIKLGRGGIREIEFFVQTQQLVAGGRHPELRGAETLPRLQPSPRAAGSAPMHAAISKPPIDSFAPSNTACRWLRTIRPIRCPRTAKASNALRDLPDSRIVDAFAQKLVEHLRKVQRNTSNCSRTLRRGPISLHCPFPRTPTTARRSTASARWAIGNRWRCPPRCAAG
jgi:glutamine synthetase adenylyltransferase